MELRKVKVFDISIYEYINLARHYEKKNMSCHSAKAHLYYGQICAQFSLPFSYCYIYPAQVSACFIRDEADGTQSLLSPVYLFPEMFVCLNAELVAEAIKDLLE